MKYGKMQKRLMVLMVFGIFWVAGCAEQFPRPDDKLANVETAISRARESGANTLAPLDIKKAEEKLAAARASVKNEDNLKAAQLADEALADAELAEAKSRAEIQKKRSDDVKESVDTLRNELNKQ